MRYSRRVSGLVSDKSPALRDVLNRLKAEGTQIYDFAVGELDDEAPDKLREIIIRVGSKGNNRYTDSIGEPRLRAAIASTVSEKFDIRASADDVAVTAGAKQALFDVALALFEPGDEVIIPTPHWTTFPAQVAMMGAKPILVPTNVREGFKLSAADLQPHLTANSRAIILNIPQNPSGATYDIGELKKIGQIASSAGLIVVLDICYCEFIYDDDSYIARVLKCFDPELLIIVNSFSKSLAITGWRIGYCVAPAPLISVFRTLHSNTTSNPNSVAQAAVYEALRSGLVMEFVTSIRHRLATNRQLVHRYLGEFPQFKLTLPDGGFYAYLTVNPSHVDASQGLSVSDTFCVRLLEQTGVQTVPGNSFGDPCGVRLSFAAQTKAVDRGLSAAALYFKG